jgi:hypothetical protein
MEDDAMTTTDADSSQALYDEAQACHDADPGRGAELLRRIDPAALATDCLPGLAFLLNHVFGEKLGAWAEAHALFGPLLRAAGDADPPPVLRRQAAAAAGLAGNDAAAARHADALAQATGATAAQVRGVVALTQTMFRVPRLAAGEAAQAVSAALPALLGPDWPPAGTPLDGAAAACLNNLASGLIERPAPDLQDPDLRIATQDAAQLAERFWLRAGTWVNHERAAYLSALVANGFGDAAQAREHALRGLALLDANDSERAQNVDRAFLLLERSRACRPLGLVDEAKAALDEADALAAQFGDAGLDEWYASRRAVSVGA